MKTPTPPLPDRLAAVGLSAKAASDLLPFVNVVSLKAGEIVFHGGDPCKYFVLPISGSLNVMLTTSSGREMLLYSVEPGELCVQTFQCLATGVPYSAEGHVVADMDALILPAAHFQTLMGESREFRTFVLRIVANRFASLTGLVETVASVPIPVRLAKFLLAHSVDGRLKITQDTLAIDISSSREGVSRMLNQWKQQGLISLSRGTITLLDRHAILQISRAEV